MIHLLLLASVACSASTSIPELEAGISRACRDGLVSIDLSGDHDVLTETLVLDRDFGGKDLSAREDEPGADVNLTRASLAGFQAAMESAKILEPVYHSRRFIWQVRDRKNRPLCHFTVEDEQTVGRCTAQVGK